MIPTVADPDVAAKQEIMNEIVALARGGMAVMFISAEMDEVMRVADRVIVMRDRGKAGELPGGCGEHAVYDRESGQLFTGTFMDYSMPRADEQPEIVLRDHSLPSPGNPLGVKGAGEAGTTAAIAAVMNAFADAIPGSGKSIQMPATPEKVWKACREMTG